MMPLSFFEDLFSPNQTINYCELVRAFFVWCRLHEGGPSNEK